MLFHEYFELNHRKINIKEEVIDSIFVYDNSISKEQLKKCLKQCFPHWPELPKIKEILSKFNGKNNEELIVLDEELNRYLNCGLAPLITKKKFRYVECRKCDKKYLPEEIEISSWMIGEGLCAEGGEKLVDPNNHCLAVVFQWNS